MSYRITVMHGNQIVAVYHASDAVTGEWIARATHGGRCRYVVEAQS